LFESDALFSRVAQMLVPLRFLVYALPLLVAVAVFVVLFNSQHILSDFSRLWTPVPFVAHVFVALVTVNFWSRFMAAVACRGMGGEVPGFGLTYRGLVPRFEAELRGVGKMTRRQQMWIAATPLLVKLLLLSAGVILWSMSRASGSHLALFGFDMAGVALISLVLTVNPVGKSDGYALIAAYLGMPRLRRRAFGVLFSSFLPSKERQDLERAMQGIDVRPLRVYATASLVFFVVFFGAVLFLAAVWLEFSLGGLGVAVFITIVAVIAYRMRDTFGRVRNASEEMETATVSEFLGRRFLGWIGRNKYKLGTLVLLAVLSILPYQYEPGGEVELRPLRHLVVNAQTEGIVEEVYFKGGEWVSANALIARLASYQQEKNVGVTRAQISAQEAKLQKLLTTPRPEEVALNKAQVETARVRAEYEKAEFARQQTLYLKKVISEQEYLDAKAKMDKAVNELLEARATLALTMAGPHPDQIAAERAELERLRESLRHDEERLERTRMVTPIEGRLATPHLNDLIGTYVKEGDLISEVDDDRTMLAQISLPEADVEGVQVGAEAKLKIWSYPVDLVKGKVTRIDPVAEKTGYGRVVNVTIEVPNEQFLLKSGMTGYGKVSVATVPAIVAFTRWLVRFFRIELWSWLP
jgi:multidrug efflux pump subunit AcrA (membrane-fusion protein)